jgi:hypothetical protein
MNKINICLIIGIVILIISILYLKTNENFTTSSVSQSNGSSTNTGDIETKIRALLNEHLDDSTHNSSDLIPKTAVEMAAKKAANTIVDNINKNCPMDFNETDWVRKTDIELERQCPSCPDLKDYVLKSTIPPIQKCPPCICPKVKVEAGLCKKCPEPKNNCPRPAACDANQCKNVIKCEPHQKQVHCPKCPAPEACPKPVEKLCPAIDLPNLNTKCPSPQPCALPEKCPDGQGRCPDKKCPSCTFKGIETITPEINSAELVEELLFSDDPKLKELLNLLKYKLSLNQNPSPTEMSILNDKIEEAKQSINRNVRGVLETPNETSNEMPNAPPARVNGGKQYEYGASDINYVPTSQLV